MIKTWVNWSYWGFLMTIHSYLCRLKSYGHGMPWPSWYHDGMTRWYCTMFGLVHPTKALCFLALQVVLLKKGREKLGFTVLLTACLKFCLRHNPTIITFPVLRQSRKGKSVNLFNKEVLAPAHCGKTPRNQPMRPLRMFHLRKFLEVLHGTVGYMSRNLKLKN